MKNHIKNYLAVTKKEWNGLVVLIILIGLIFATPSIYNSLHKDKEIDFKDFNIAAARLQQAQRQSGGFDDDQKVAHPTMVSFNPNNLPPDQWLKLGLSAYQVKVIKNYEAKGGRFYSKADVKKIYSITDEDYKQLAPYINLPDKETAYIEKSAVVVELNSADSAKLTGIRGIGPAFALKIVRFRERLGGFYQKEQLKDIYGIDSVRYHDIAPQVKVNPERIVKIKINTVTLNELRLFPYLSFKQANAIVEYRNQHGNYAMLSDLKNIVLIDDNILRKIEPYIEF